MVEWLFLWKVMVCPTARQPPALQGSGIATYCSCSMLSFLSCQLALRSELLLRRFILVLFLSPFKSCSSSSWIYNWNMISFQLSVLEFLDTIEVSRCLFKQLCHVLFVTNLSVCQVSVCDSHHSGSACFACSNGMQLTAFLSFLKILFLHFLASVWNVNLVK